MSEIYLTSDTHFCHQQEFLWKLRGFGSVQQMNEVIIDRWNSVVRPHDTVYHLGDTMLNDNDKGIECFRRLNGHIFLIIGNHDTTNRIDRIFRECYFIYGGVYATLIKHDKFSLYLSHYPTLTSNFDQKHFSQHVINLHGHTHQQTNWLDPKNPFMYHVGLDSHNCTPVHIDEVISDIRQRWNDLSKMIQPQDTYPYISTI